MVQGGIIVSVRDEFVFRIVEDFREGRVNRKQASQLLGVTERQVTRLTAKVRRHGLRGVKHGNCGRSPVNRLSDDVRQKSLNLAATLYPDFNMQHCLEILRERHSIAVSYGTFHHWCRNANIGKHRRRRPSKARLQRERMSNEGLMLQMDGSHHSWNGREKWCLISLIDDATSQIPAAKFFPSETTQGCMEMLRRVVEQKGIPEAILTDCAGWAAFGKRENFSQFKRVCEELGIRLISTPVPESKGRIERSYRTFQDRLVPELRLNGIVGMTDANRYLEQVFLPGYWNARNTVLPRLTEPRYRAVPGDIDLDRIFCEKHERTVRSNHTIEYDGQTYRLKQPSIGSLNGKIIDVIVSLKEAPLRLQYGHLNLEYTEVRRPKRRWLCRAG
jgi:transposase-like protein